MEDSGWVGGGGEQEQDRESLDCSAGLTYEKSQGRRDDWLGKSLATAQF